MNSRPASPCLEETKADPSAAALLFRRYRAGGDRRVRDQLVQLHLGLAQSVARRFQGRGESHDDLQQVAYLALLNAIERFDPERGVAFSTYAVPTMSGELKRHFRDRGWMIRVPRSLKECRSDVTAATSDLTQELGRAPEPSEVAERIGVPVRLVVDSLEARQAYRCASLDSPRSTDDSALGDRIGRPDHGYDAVLDQSAVAQLLDTLPARERRIVVLRFFGNLTQSEIARRLDISQMHVSRLLRDALASLRAELDSAAGQAHRGRRGHAVGSPCCCAQQYPAQPPTNAA